MDIVVPRRLLDLVEHHDRLAGRHRGHTANTGSNTSLDLEDALCEVAVPRFGQEHDVPQGRRRLPSMRSTSTSAGVLAKVRLALHLPHPGALRDEVAKSIRVAWVELARLLLDRRTKHEQHQH